MRATLVLCDYAAQDIPGGKAHLIGAGWSVIGPVPSPHGIAAFVKVGWNEANEAHKFTLRLVDADGSLVSISGPAGPQPLAFQGNLEVGRPPGIPQGSEIDATFVANVGSLPLLPGQRYAWQIEIDGNVVATESFLVRQSFVPLGPLSPDA
jgi:hypothetical protein